MFKKKYYVILGVVVLVLVTFSSLAIYIKKNITKFAFTQVKKEDFETQTRLIMRHLKNGENDLAIKLAKEYLTSNSNDITIINVLTEAYINKGDLSTAETTVRRGIAIQPDDPWACRLLGRIYRIKTEEDPNAKSNNLSLALEQVEKGLVSNPNDIWLLAEAAQIYSEQGDKAKANQTIERALNIVPNDNYLISVKENINREAKEPIKK